MRTGCAQLVSLDVSRSAATTNETLRDLDGSCPVVAELNISGCINITLEGVEFSNLRRLRAARCFSPLCQTALQSFSALVGMLESSRGIGVKGVGFWI